MVWLNKYVCFCVDLVSVATQDGTIIADNVWYLNGGVDLDLSLLCSLTPELTEVCFCHILILQLHCIILHGGNIIFVTQLCNINLLL